MNIQEIPFKHKTKFSYCKGGQTLNRLLQRLWHFHPWTYLQTAGTQTWATYCRWHCPAHSLDQGSGQRCQSSSATLHSSFFLFLFFVFFFIVQILPIRKFRENKNSCRIQKWYKVLFEIEKNCGYFYPNADLHLIHKSNRDTEWI